MQQLETAPALSPGRPLKLFIAHSLDGFIAREDGGLDWLYSDQDYGYAAFYGAIDTVIMGRKTFEVDIRFGGYHFADKRGYVFTKQIPPPNPRVFEPAQAVSEDPVDFTRRLKAEGDADSPGIWLVGGAEITRLLLAADLVDEMILSSIPRLIRRGIRLFARAPTGQDETESGNAARAVNDADWDLHRIESFATGLVQAHYVRRR